MTLVTKNSYIDNWWSEIKNTVEVGYYSRKAFIEHDTGRVLKNTGVPENCQAFKLGMAIAKESEA